MYGKCRFPLQSLHNVLHTMCGRITESRKPWVPSRSERKAASITGLNFSNSMDWASSTSALGIQLVCVLNRKPRESREPRDPRDPREPREPKEPREPREPREGIEGNPANQGTKKGTQGTKLKGWPFFSGE